MTDPTQANNNAALSGLEKIMVYFSTQGGSDLFITEGRPVTMKKDNTLIGLTEEKLTPSMIKNLCYELMDSKQTEEFETHQELNFAYRIPGMARFRVNAFVQRGSFGLVIRSIKAEIPRFEDLNLPTVLKESVMEKLGLILIVGGTGSGKSTTLASMIDVRNESMDGHIITIEDPIEFVHSHKKSIVTQREVGVDTESYQTALKNTLRQAPNAILIGEIRDRNTMEHAISFAETGHLCLSTLHANNTNQALDRIINFFPVDQHNRILMDLSLNIKAFVSQRLVPRIGGGMVAAIEVMINTPRISELILQGKVNEIKEVVEKSSAVGMQTFDQAIFDLYEDKKITYMNALRAADSKNNLRLKIKLDSKLPPPEDELNGSQDGDEANSLALRSHE